MHSSRFLLQYSNAKWLYHVWDGVSGRREEQLLWTFFSRDRDYSAHVRGILVGTSVFAQYSGTESQDP